VAALLLEEAKHRHPPILEEEARSTRMDVMGARWITHIG
jgi:hypothetical protein